MNGPVDLNGVRMCVSAGDEAGVCTKDTLLSFEQRGNLVLGRYQGGPVLVGHLIGHLKGRQIKFRYVQADVSGNLDSGVSDGAFDYLPNGLLQLTEHFSWETRPSTGINVFLQIRT
jgi:hypothetical protein